MIKFINISSDKPYEEFHEIYHEALDNNQNLIHAVNISSFDVDTNEVESRMVNLKYINNNEWTFFSNYKSPKASHFAKHDQISAIFYWDSIDAQIRIKAKIKKSQSAFSDMHFKSRPDEKNALSISSMQSKKINSYEDIEKNYKKVLKDKKLLNHRPKYWGGFSFEPYYFEFWRGHKNRINKRRIYSKNKDSWDFYFLQP